MNNVKNVCHVSLVFLSLSLEFSKDDSTFEDCSTSPSNKSMACGEASLKHVVKVLTCFSSFASLNS